MPNSCWNRNDQIFGSQKPSGAGYTKHAAFRSGSQETKQEGAAEERGGLQPRPAVTAALGGLTHRTHVPAALQVGPVHAHTHTHTCAHTCAHTRAHTDARTHATHVRAHTHMHARMHTHTHARAHTCTHSHACTHTHPCTHTHTHTVQRGASEFWRLQPDLRVTRPGATSLHLHPTQEGF